MRLSAGSAPTCPAFSAGGVEVGSAAFYPVSAVAVPLSSIPRRPRGGYLFISLFVRAPRKTKPRQLVGRTIRAMTIPKNSCLLLLVEFGTFAGYFFHLLKTTRYLVVFFFKALARPIGHHRHSCLRGRHASIALKYRKKGRESREEQRKITFRPLGSAFPSPPLPSPRFDLGSMGDLFVSSSLIW